MFNSHRISALETRVLRLELRLAKLLPALTKKGRPVIHKTEKARKAAKRAYSRAYYQKRKLTK